MRLLGKYLSGVYEDCEGINPDVIEQFYGVDDPKNDSDQDSDSDSDSKTFIKESYNFYSKFFQEHHARAEKTH